LGSAEFLSLSHQSMSQPQGLQALPAELYLKVLSFLVIARDVTTLSKTCKRFLTLNEERGWKIFVDMAFPTMHVASSVVSSEYWKDAARALVSQSASWDRRAFFATPLLDDGTTFTLDIPVRHDGSTTRPFHLDDRPREDGQQNPHRTSRQSTDYHPVIDSKVEYFGSLTVKREVLVYGAGATLLVRIRGNEDSKRGPRETMLRLCHGDFLQGFHDITSVNLCSAVGVDISRRGVDVIVGRASGHLHRFQLTEGSVPKVINTFRTSVTEQTSLSRRSIRGTDTNSALSPLLAAVSDKVLSLYDLNEEQHDIRPAAELTIDRDRSDSTVWTAKFLSHDKLVVGLGLSWDPLHIYQVAPSGITLTQKLNGPELFGSHTIEPRTQEVRPTDSIYAIEPLSPMSRVGGSLPGQIYLTGWYSGLCW
jgi:hypothetical protein